MAESTVEHLISVVIPTLNVEDYVGECIQSALDQTLAPCEIIVVDNGSTDRTTDRVNEYVERHPGFVQLIHEGQPGAPFARNKGLALARGEWIQFLDADDLLMPEKFALQMQDDQGNASIKVTATTIQHIDGIRMLARLKTPVWYALFMGEGALGFTSSILWKTEAVRQVGGFNTDLPSSQEYDLLFRVMRDNSDVQTLKDPLVLKRERGITQISRANRPRSFYYYLLLRKKMYDFIVEHDLVSKRYLKIMCSQFASKYHLLRKKDTSKKEELRGLITQMHDNAARERMTLWRGYFRYLLWSWRMWIKNDVLDRLSEFSIFKPLVHLLIGVYSWFHNSFNSNTLNKIDENSIPK